MGFFDKPDLEAEVIIGGLGPCLVRARGQEASMHVQNFDFDEARSGDIVRLCHRRGDYYIAGIIQKAAPRVTIGSGHAALQEAMRAAMRGSGSSSSSDEEESPTMDTKLKISKVPGTDWDDVCGNEEAKRQLMDALVTPYTNKELYEAYGKRPCKGILMSGPPGCGKTMLARAAAYAIAQTHHKKDDNVPASFFFSCKGSQFNEQYVGVGEQAIRKMFADAKAHQKKHGYPAVIFMDEADGLLMARDETPSRSGHREAMVTTFLTEMDGFEQGPAPIVIMATNRPDTLDPAVTREGRIDFKVRVERPDAVTTGQIAYKNLHKIPIAKESNAETLSVQLAEKLFSDEYVLKKVKVDGEDKNFCLRDVVSGSMIVAMIEQAKSLAMHRDITAKAKKATGITPEDIDTCVESTFKQQRHLNHSQAVNDFKEKFANPLH